jgi:hypothetical protein
LSKSNLEGEGGNFGRNQERAIDALVDLLFLFDKINLLI